MGAFLILRWMKAEPSSTLMMLPKARNAAVTAPIAMLLYMLRMPDKFENTISHTPTDSNVKEHTNLHSTCSPKKFFRKPGG